MKIEIKNKAFSEIAEYFETTGDNVKAKSNGLGRKMGKESKAKSD